MMMMILSIIFFATAIASTNGQSVGTLRLIRNKYFSTIQAYTSGIVEIVYNGTWGNICDDSSLGYDEANVICHQLAFTGVSSYGRVGDDNHRFGNDTFPTLISGVSCSSSSYLALLSQCTYSSTISSFCNNDDNDLYVFCYSTRIWDNPYAGQIRLVGGTYSNQGRLEVYCNSQWGTVCDDTFTPLQAYVACNQLGYNIYSRYDYTTSLAGSSSQPIWLNNLVGCTSLSQHCLAYCQRCPSTPSRYCLHSEDVTLECTSTTLLSATTTNLTTCQFASTSTSSTTTAVIVAVVVVVIIIILVVVIFVVVFCVVICVGVCAASKSTKKTANDPDMPLPSASVDGHEQQPKPEPTPEPYNHRPQPQYGHEPQPPYNHGPDPPPYAQDPPPYGQDPPPYGQGEIRPHPAYGVPNAANPAAQAFITINDP